MSERAGDAVSPSTAFWEKLYQQRTRPPSGRPNPILAGVAEPLPAGRALDLGCGLGDDTLWLARRGWRVTAVDVSATAVAGVAARAAEAGLDDRVDAQVHDLATSFPAGAFDLIYALYLQSPVDFGRARALQHATRAVAAGGRLLVVVHGSIQPWSWSQDPNTRFPTPREQLAELELASGEWEVEIADTPQREATGPNGETATATDVVTLIRRAAP